MDACQGWGIIIIMACLSQLECHILVKCLASVQLSVGQMSVREELGGQACVNRCMCMLSRLQIHRTNYPNTVMAELRGQQGGVGMSMIMPTFLSLLLRTKYLTGQRDSCPTKTKPVIKGTGSRCLSSFSFFI